MGAFDDLIPAPDQTAAPSGAGGVFSDLIPAQGATPPPADDDLDRAIQSAAPSGGMFSDIWPEIRGAAKDALSSINSAFNPNSPANLAIQERENNAAPWDISGEISGVANMGRGLAAIPSLIGSPFTGVGRSVIGHALADTAPKDYYGPNLTQEQIYAAAKHDADLAMMAMAPGRAGVRPPLPVPPAPADPFGITLSAGEKASDLGMRQAEQAAIRGADPHVQAFADQRKAQIEAANKNLVQGLDPFGQTLAETPQEAGTLLSQGVQGAANTAKAGVKAAYEQARSMPGVIDADVFRGMGQGIKTDLTNTAEPVFVNEKLTPFASYMIDHLDNQIALPAVQNKADPLGAPDPNTVLGVNLNGVDQMRRVLSTMRRDAYSSGNGADGRAARAILDAFDNRIDDAVNGGSFTGDPAAVNAWNNARAANTDYRSTFTAGKNDPVGRVVQKIIGDNTNDPLTPGKVMDQLVGSSRTTPSTLNIGVANRLKTILGEQSPEWIGAKQGLLGSLIQSGEGEAGYGTGQIAQRLSKFLNSDLAPVVYSPAEQNTLRAYANLMRQITMPPGSYFPSAPGINKVVSVVANRIGAVIGGLVGRSLLPGMPLVGELGGLTAGSQAEKALMRMHQNVAKQLPLVSQQMKTWQKAVNAANKFNSPPARLAAATATANLAQSLAPLGITFQGMAGTPPAYGGPNQQQQQPVPGPPAQQKHGGRVSQKPNAVRKGHEPQPYRDGTPVVKVGNGNGGGFHPAQIGARLAKDGRWYVRDPKRPGKFLWVRPKAA